MQRTACPLLLIAAVAGFVPINPGRKNRTSMLFYGLYYTGFETFSKTHAPVALT